jgi:hypothetical protein
VPFLEPLEERQLLATYIVDDIGDSNMRNGADGTLR